MSKPTNKSTDTVEQLVENNVRLVHHIANKYLHTAGCEYDELVAHGLFGLYKAAVSWEPSKSKFVTYAHRCVNNEILMFLRKVRRIPFTDSLDEVTPQAGLDNADANRHEYVASCSSTDGDVIFQQYLKQVTEYIDKLSDRDRMLFVSYYGLGDKEPMKQRELADITGLSQSYVARLLKKLTDNLVEYIKFITAEDKAV